MSAQILGLKKDVKKTLVITHQIDFPINGSTWLADVCY